MKNWKIITIVTGLFVALATVGAVRFSANTIPLEAQVKMEAGLPADANIPNYKYQALIHPFYI